MKMAAVSSAGEGAMSSAVKSRCSAAPGTPLIPGLARMPCSWPALALSFLVAQPLGSRPAMTNGKDIRWERKGWLKVNWSNEDIVDRKARAEEWKRKEKGRQWVAKQMSPVVINTQPEADCLLLQRETLFTSLESREVNSSE